MSKGNYDKILKQFYFKKKIKIYSHIFLIQLLPYFCTLKYIFKSCQLNRFRHEVTLVLRNSKIVEVHLRHQESQKVTDTKPPISQGKLLMLSLIINLESLLENVPQCSTQR